jgi:5-methyltetrahydropteroyltriglutamate--homocysteine methyltransferase
LQLDCPDLAFGMMWFRNDRDRMRREVARRVEAIDEATAGVPPEAMRMHVCWGNYEGPHHFDVELRDIIDLIIAARPSGLALESANPRHAHDWEVFEDVTLPDGKYLIPGVIDSTTNYIEHPDLVRQRIKNFTSVVGPERVVAGCDCGFGTIAGRPNVVPSLVFAKFESLVDGARRASLDLFS